MNDENQQSKIVVVVPAFNEADNLRILVPRILASTTSMNSVVDVIVVDDGSTDETKSVVDQLHMANPSVELCRLSRNCGKAAALRRGFREALERGASVIVMMDADGQDDPVELPRLVDELDNGYDLVTGARHVRNDRFIKRSTSKWYNRVTGTISGAPGRDFNSGFKAMSAETARNVEPMLYGELHRYITVIAHWLGHRTTEISVAHHQRMNGKSKYGINRYWRGFLDLMTVRFLMSYESRPSHLFGGMGFLSLSLGSVMLTWLLWQRIAGESIGGRPMLLAGVLLVIVGLQLILFGLLAELMVYTRQQNGSKSES